MKNEIKELKINPEKKFSELVEAARKPSESLGMGQPKLVGREIHFIIGEALSSIGDYANGFKKEDYED